MHTDTARAIALTQLDDERLMKLHEYETKIGRCLAPSEIFNIGKLKKTEGIQENIWKPWERQIFSLTIQVRAGYLSDCETEQTKPDLIYLAHHLDIVIRNRIKIVVPERRRTSRLLNIDLTPAEEMN